MIQQLEPYEGYKPGHPWYYRLGGKIPSPKQIEAYAMSAEYRGYLAGDINDAMNRVEPQRSAALRKIRTKVIADLRKDMSCYRGFACKLRRFRSDNSVKLDEHGCDNIHTAMSLKFAHIYNGFANLKTLDNVPNKQLDLF
ncbi:MAG: hypothetical protein JKY10_11865 [Cohaesibacteraceae bacterium]|nr:hypothetical protein [Cohaesibacteraceae bacterium]